MQGSHIKVIHILCACACVCIYTGYFLIYIKYMFKMNETITGKGIIQFHDSMAECEGKESMKCPCTIF